MSNGSLEESGVKRFIFNLKQIHKWRMLIWRDTSGICFKLGVSISKYGDWCTLLPTKRPYYYTIPILKKELKAPSPK